MLGCAVIAVDRLYGGRNSQVFKLTCNDSAHYALKIYARDSFLGRDRLGTEVLSLKFLWDNDVRCVPWPVVADDRRGYAIYEYIEGTKILPEDVTEREIDSAVQFLEDLNELTEKEDSNRLPPASEAQFSTRGIVENIRLRLEMLGAVRGGGPQYHEFREFLTNDFTPLFDDVANWCKSRLNESKMPFDWELPQDSRILSPSDFGFHNALKRGDETVFLDFEYFGWDDPAKTISDFLLHPAMMLDREMKQRFVCQMLRHFDDLEQLANRLSAMYPLFGLKWCLILLNEFIPESLHRLEFASGSAPDIIELQRAQLEKAVDLLARVQREYEAFPYFG